jgi:hypothetical protein
VLIVGDHPLVLERCKEVVRLGSGQITMEAVA